MSEASWSAGDAAALLAALTPDEHSHKYSRGVLGLRTGSSAYPGAAVLSAEAAWRTGIGLVRYTPPLGDGAPALGLPTPASAVLAARPETVFAEHAAAAHARTDAWLIGSGTDPAVRSFAEREALISLLQGDAPVVVDAGALDLVSLANSATPIIITPHRGEFARLWRAAGLGDGDVGRNGDGEAAILAQTLGVTVLLKGSVTTVASPGGLVLSSGPATPWLATAGTGDVLAGILGALVATHGAEVREDPDALAPLGATAALLHDTAARIASQDGRAPITALDVAHAIPEAHAHLTSDERV